MRGSKNTREENLAKLNTFFIKRYSERLEALNQNLKITDTDSNGNFRVPSFRLSDGGFTQVIGNDKEPFFVSSATFGFEDVYFKPLHTVYRASIPYLELEIGLERDSEYLVYLMDTFVNQLVDRWRVGVGDENLTRFGKTYFNYNLDKKGPFNLNNKDDFEIKIYGCWASEEAAYVEEPVTQDYLETYSSPKLVKE